MHGESARLEGHVLAHKYEVGPLLGEGGFAEVYRARHRLLDHQIALKVLKPRWIGHTLARESFAAEARLCAQVKHPNVVRVHDFDETSSGLCFLVLELVDGRPIREYLEQDPPPLATALWWIDGVLSGLHAAHSHQVIHGDIKPSNILAGPSGVKLIDFGAAGMSSPGGRRSTIYGTPQYMAPEVAQGAGASSAGDLYAVGVILHELVNGHVPFQGRTAGDIFRAHASAPIELNNDPVLGPLTDVVRRALEKHPADRYDSADAMRRALQRATAELSESTCKASLSEIVPTDIVDVDIDELSAVPELVSADGDFTERSENAVETRTTRAHGKRRRRSVRSTWNMR